MNNEIKIINEIQGWNVYQAIRYYNDKYGDDDTERAKWNPAEMLPHHTDILKRDYGHWLLCANLADNNAIETLNFYENHSLSEVHHLYTILLANKYRPPEKKKRR